MKYVGGLDGIRALAVIAVLASHTAAFASGGALGVDVFFVLSGFLITSILLAEYDKRGGKVSLRDFYIKRALRLFPALAVVLVLTAPLLFGVLRDTLSLSPGAALAAAAFYVSNWVSVVSPDGMGPLDHTWSLAIEEQFYLLWPLALIAAMRSRHREKMVLAVALVGIVGVVVSRAVWWAATSDVGVYYATTSRADGLLLGCAVAVLLARRPQLFDRLGPRNAVVAGVGLVAMSLYFERVSPGLFLGGYTVAAVLAAVLMVTVVNGRAGAVGRMLEWRPLVYVGRVSYGIYLYHYPIFIWAATWHISPVEQKAAGYALTVVVVVASWFLVERPALSMKQRLTRRGSAVSEVVH